MFVHWMEKLLTGEILEMTRRLLLMPLRNCVTGHQTARFVTFILALVLLGAVASSTWAQAWFDTFDDGSFDDGDPVTWSINPAGAFPGNYDAESGDFVFAPLEDEDDNESMIATVDSSLFENTASVRIRGMIVPEVPDAITGEGNLGVTLFFDPATISGYVGLLDAANNLILISVTNGEIQDLGEYVVLDFPATEEVYVQMDYDGENIGLSAWEVGTPQPAAAQFIVEDATHSSGFSGLVFNEDAPMDIGVYHWARAAGVRILDGDVDIDGIVGTSDIDTMFANLGSSDPLYDLDEDGDADNADVDLLVETLLDTFYGDANLDGRADAADLNQIGINWQSGDLGWENGDFTGDRNVNAADLNVLGINWQMGAPAAASAVPEPTGIALLLLGVVGFAVQCRGRRK